MDANLTSEVTMHKLYLVEAQMDGPPTDPDLYDNMQMLVWAVDQQQASKYWDDYFDGWDKPEAVYVTEIPTQGMPGVVTWEVLPMDRIVL